MAMNVPNDERHRPYAAAANVIAVLQRVRARNLPDRIDGDFLRVAGVRENVFGRVSNALRFLGLIEADDRPTDLLQSISAAPEQEYKQLLEGALREAYREDFARIDPSEDPQAKIVDSFAPYQPRSQTSRMVMLFLGLCREAGIPVLDAPRERSMRASSTTRSRRRQSAQPASKKEAPAAPSAGPVVSGGLAGLTEADLGKLDEETFTELWTALGKAVYKVRTTPPPRSADTSEGGEVTDNVPDDAEDG